MRFLTGGGRKKREGKGRREKLDPAPNSIEGERSQFGLAAEGRLQQSVSPEAAVAGPLPLSPGLWKRGAGHGDRSKHLSPCGQMGVNERERDGKWL